MPNWVQNNVTLYGNPELIEKLRKEIKGEEDSIIDFNKIVKMPEALEEPVLFSNLTTDNIVSEITNGGKSISDYPDISPFERSAVLQTLEKWYKYGATGWYEWRLAHWGCKWNASEQYEASPNEIGFQTPWSHPEEIFCALSEKYPDLIISVEWADEDLGVNCGAREYQAGSIIFESYPETEDKQNLRFACRVWNYDFDEMCEDEEEDEDAAEEE